jgi:hypothetical protein
MSEDNRARICPQKTDSDVYNPPMTRRATNPNPARGRNAAAAPSLAPINPDQAMRALLRVKPADVRRLESREGKAPKGGKAKGGRK